MKKNIILAFLFVIIIHLTYISNGFVWLDHNDIEQNFAVLPLNQLDKAFFEPFGQTGFYRPIVTITNSIDFAIYKNWAPGYHITNLIIFLLGIFASLKFISAFFNIEKKYYPLIVLLLGVHPVGIFISGAINQRQESLLLTFTLLCLTFYQRATKSKELKDMLFSVIFFILSLFTKETAIVIIPSFILLFHAREFLLKGKFDIKTKSSSVFKSIALPIILTLFSLLYVLVRQRAVPGSWGTSQPQLSLGEHIALRFYLFGKMLIDLINPLKPRLSDATPIVELSSLSVLVTIFIVGGSLFYIFKKGIKDKVSFALSATLLMLLPGLNIVPVPRISSPHYSYLILTPFCALGVTIAQLQKNLLKKVIFLIVFIFIITSSFTTFASGKFFKNDEILFTGEVKKDPRFSEAYYFLGNYYLKNGKFDLAAENLRKADIDYPNYLIFKNKISIKFNLATSLMQTGKGEEALTIYKSIYSEANEDLKPYIIFNEALIYYQEESYDKAVELLESRDWDIQDAYLLLAQIYKSEGKLDKQQEVMQRLIPKLGN